MNLSLPRRLQVCADFVTPGDRVADIGCDHGYLSIYLLKSGKASSVIASDIREMPLLSAVNNAEKYGVREKIEFYLSDGVRKLPREFDCLVCAGMGGDTMISILEAAPWLKSGQYRLILQCQSKRPELRRYLSEQGWYIREETVVKDGKFLYTVMEILWQPDSPRLTPGQCYFSPALLKNSGGDLPAFYTYVCRGLEIALEHQKDSNKAQALEELKALGREYTWLKEETK